VFLSFGTNLELYHVDKKGEKKGLSFWGILQIIAWPYGMLYLTHELVKHVDKKLSEKE